jgi:hypothetical protein
MPLSSSGLNLAGDLWLELKGSSGFSLLVYLCANWLALLLKQGFFNPVTQGSRRLSSRCRLCVMNASHQEGANKSSWHSGLHSHWRSRHLTEDMPGPVKVG